MWATTIIQQGPSVVDPTLLLILFRISGMLLLLLIRFHCAFWTSCEVGVACIPRGSSLDHVVEVNKKNSGAEKSGRGKKKLLRANDGEEYERVNN